MSGNIVGKPDLTGGGCWVLIERHTGKMIAQSTSCGKAPRPGALTCSHHQHLEREARRHQEYLKRVGKES
jgi:hypothetical protein